MTAWAIAAAACGLAGWAYWHQSWPSETQGVYDIELLTQSRREQIYVGRYEVGQRPESIFDSSEAFCKRVILASSETCIIFVFDASSYEENESQNFGKTENHDDTVANIARIFLGSQNVDAVYVYEPQRVDASGQPARQFFVIDCAKFGDRASTSRIVCKGSDTDEFSRSVATRLSGAGVTEANPVAARSYADSVVVDPDVSTWHVIADTNVREQPSGASAIIGQFNRGEIVAGSIVPGGANGSNWLQLLNGVGYLSVSNLSRAAPPLLTTRFDDTPFRPHRNIVLSQAPSETSAFLETVEAGTLIFLKGITENGYAEARTSRGVVGYFPAEGMALADDRLND